MSLHTLETTTRLPVSPDEAWAFFSSPLNLKTITPDHLGFQITSSGADQPMYPGMIISYIIRPVLGIPMEWVTEITHVREKEFFVDEQRAGPYAIWHHQHFFNAIAGGVEMRDIVHYQVPFGPLGDMVNALFVRKEVLKIFDYRAQKMEQLFGKFPGNS